jgi:putative ABC transport system permease protein
MSKLKSTLRGLARTPLFLVVAVVSLALGIGVNTAIFSLLDQMLLRSLPVPAPHELVYLYHPGPWQGNVSSDENGDPSFSYPIFRELQREQTPFTGLAGARAQQVALSYEGHASSGNARLVSGNYFAVMRTGPALGRVLTEDDDRVPGAHPFVVLGHGYWTSRFGADPAVLNRTIVVNAQPMTIVGVAQKGFAGERMGSAPDVFVPISMKREITPDWDGLHDRMDAWVTMVGRLKPGVTLERAALEINVAYRGQLEQDLQLLKQPGADFLERYRAKKIVLTPGAHGRGGPREEGWRPMTLLMSLALMVLLIACANVANLQLARSAARTREMAVRLALGSSRWQLVRQLLAESLVVALAGGALGVLLAYWTSYGILASIPASQALPGFLSASLDGRVLLFCLGLSLATGVLFGLFPALQASKPDVVTALKGQAGQVSSAGASRLRKILVTAQLSLSVMLLVAAGLFGKTLVNLARVDLGMQVDHLVTFSISPKWNKYSDERVEQLHRQLRERLAAIPGVRSVSAANMPAVAGSTSSTSIVVEGYAAQGDRGTQANIAVVDPGYFSTMGVPLIGGREFTPADNLAGPRVAIVNEAFVRKFFGGENPLGRHLGRTSTGANARIIGVVKDASYASMRTAPPPVFYLPLEQQKQWGSVFYYVRTAIDPEQTFGSVQRELAALDPNLPLRGLKTMRTQLEENTFKERLLSRLTASFSLLATTLAAVGLYGILAFTVARRTREIGIRMALGARTGHVRKLVAREMSVMLALGLVLGLAGAAGAARLVQSFLYGMEPWDPAAYGMAVVVLGAVAVVAGYVPARRAAGVDPMVALRYE